ncbi:MULTISPECIES: substrate-binding domain-containing protein [unclassified Sphingopyxis]|uniref:substrate-binding domain-containing protein n=1 Tax=unclassified Sphingopyxis TaxID=2614943 RepID=UPI000736B8C3|nr:MULTISPECIES: substrate-binding domain-containing protein [unclassified Sphingopyxis]KTE31600.1 phosphate ABC transporter substrate-binding protein [Sphingopyxis sp. HIX]KTE82322.1 phosphate ABC transporter substrate-binding protein [Sphingopyxis sp. HXXIV]
MLQKFALVAGAATAVLALSACQDQASSGGAARDYISAVGSSTVYPFATTVGERFAEATGNKKPKIDSTGTGGGFERFCAGVGGDTPDIANASRRIKKKEFDTCAKNGVTEIVEIQVGIDGIALGEAARGPGFQLSEEDVYKALAANPYGKANTAKTWADVNPALPAVAISVFGPPSTSGTYDAFKELILGKGCDANAGMKALKDSNKDKHEEICTTLRGAPYYVEQGENDNLIISKLDKNPTSLGIFGFSYLDANKDKIKAVPVQGVAPSYAAIADGSYPGSRPLFIYVKKKHVGVIPGLAEYVAEFLKGAGEGGYLGAKGLIVSPKAVADVAAANAKGMTALNGAELK